MDKPEEILSQLKNLDADLKLLSLWCESSRNQISKALSLPEEEQKTTSTLATQPSANPIVAKSFSNALSAQPPLFQEKKKGNEPASPELPAETPKKKRWWQHIFS